MSVDLWLDYIAPPRAGLLPSPEDDPSMVECPDCGEDRWQVDEPCPHCGAEWPEQDEASTGRSA